MQHDRSIAKGRAKIICEKVSVQFGVKGISHYLACRMNHKPTIFKMEDFKNMLRSMSTNDLQNAAANALLTCLRGGYGTNMRNRRLYKHYKHELENRGARVPKSNEGTWRGIGSFERPLPFSPENV